MAPLEEKMIKIEFGNWFYIFYSTWFDFYGINKIVI